MSTYFFGFVIFGNPSKTIGTHGARKNLKWHHRQRWTPMTAKYAKRTEEDENERAENLAPNFASNGKFAQQIFKSICFAAHDVIALCVP